MPVDSATVLHLWDHAARLDDQARAVALAGAVAPVVDPSEVVDWPLGRRDERLLRLRAAIAGPVIDAVTTCRACEDEVAFELDTSELKAEGSDSAPVVEADGWRVTCRPVTTADLLAAAGTGDHDAAEALLGRVIIAAEPPVGTAATPLPAAVRRAVTEALATADPLAEIIIDLICPACGAAVDTSVDAASFAWAAVEARAQRVLQDVDVLARTYGWTESDVLALGDRRRASYVALARGGPS